MSTSSYFSTIEANELVLYSVIIGIVSKKYLKDKSGK